MSMVLICLVDGHPPYAAKRPGRGGHPVSPRVRGCASLNGLGRATYLKLCECRDGTGENADIVLRSLAIWIRSHKAIASALALVIAPADLDLNTAPDEIAPSHLVGKRA